MNNEINLKEIDVVYILGKGSTWSDNEIRFSLRSVDINLEHRGIFIIGDRPDFINTRFLTHIPAEDIHTEKLKNALHKLKIACLDSRISDDFVLMNDDFFILKKLPMIRYLYKCTLKQSLKAHPAKSGYYYDAIKDTLDFLKKHNVKQAKDYSVHYPIIFNKEKLLKVIELIENQEKQLLLRTVYCNMYEVKSEKKRDVKIRNLSDLKDDYFKSSRVISTSPRVVQYPEFYRFITGRLSMRSKYESI